MRWILACNDVLAAGAHTLRAVRDSDDYPDPSGNFITPLPRASPPLSTQDRIDSKTANAPEQAVPESMMFRATKLIQGVHMQIKSKLSAGSVGGIRPT
jgi:hypothetical protein